MATSSDHNVTETALDAVKCKLSAATLGYFRDDFLTHFVPKPTRRIPLIHRGYYLRHVAIADCVARFLAANEHRDAVQIVSLGAGFDTLFFRLLQEQQPGRPELRFVEIDCDAIVAAKAAILRDKLPELTSQRPTRVVSPASDPAMAFQCVVGEGASYALGASDLGDTARVSALLTGAGVDLAAPTLVLAECVVSYLEPSAGTSLLQWLAASFADATAVLYDPLALNDAFGETLQQYFAVKGCELLSLRAFQSPVDHCDRLLRLAVWQTCRIVDMNAVFDAATSAAEKKRVQALEAFDEYADWAICNAHYGIFLATTQPTTSSHWSQQFCATRGFMAQRVNGKDEATTTVLRTFQREDLKQVQKLFQSTHLDYACKAVTKFVNNRVRSGDLADVEASFFRGAGNHFWVVETVTGESREIIGCIGLKPHASNAQAAELCRLSVAKAARRRGLASRLVSTLEGFAAKSGYTSIQLDTIESMAAAQAFYRARGYVEAAERAKFSTFTLVRFSRTLTKV